jgi:SDR family mycofactocin-dependent oxidoreductase
MGRLTGKVAFISGVARGQGRSHAVRLAQEGCDIIGFDICRDVETVPYPGATRADLDETVRLVEKEGRRCLLDTADVRDLAAVQDIVDRGVAEFGRLDIIVANAGIMSMAPTLEMSEDVWDTMIEVNLTGVWKTLRASAPKMVQAGNGGSIVITSSAGATMCYPNAGHYCSAKAGLVALMRTLTKELAPLNIRVNTVHPTTTATDMVFNDATYRLFLPDEEHPTKEQYIAVAGRENLLPIDHIEPVDISNAILYLVSDDARYVTGTTHEVTAGIHLP